MKPKGWSQETEDLQKELEIWRKLFVHWNPRVLSSLHFYIGDVELTAEQRLSLRVYCPPDGLDGPRTQTLAGVRDLYVKTFAGFADASLKVFH